MRILHLNTVDSRGGASKLALSLHRQLRAVGEESDYFVRRKMNEDSTATEIGSVGDRLAERLVQERIINNNRTDITNSTFSFTTESAGGFFTDDTPLPWDVIHLHWIERFLSPGNQARLVSSGRPLVWTAHDQRPATGGCHCTYDCTGYQHWCHPCPQLVEDPFHLPERALRVRRNVFAQADLTLVAPSHWMASVLQDSNVFPGKDIRTIPHGIDTSIFTANGRRGAKEAVDVPPETTTLMFNAYESRAHHKGFSQLLETIERCRSDERFRALCSKGKIAILIVGKPSLEIAKLAIPYKAFGYIETAEEMAAVYQATDILVNPSLVESFSLVSLEAMSCGVAVAGFQTGGMVDFIDEDCGVLVSYKDTEALSAAVLDLVFGEDLRASLSRRAAARVRDGYRLDIMASRYRDLYGELLDRPPQQHSGAPPELDHFHDIVAHAALVEVNALRDSSEDKQERLSSLRERLKSERQRVSSMRKRLESAKQRVSSLRKHLKSEKQRASSLRKHLKSEKQRASSMRKRLESERQRASSLRKRLKSRRQRHRKTDHALRHSTRRALSSALSKRPAVRELLCRFRRTGIPDVTPGEISDADLLALVTSERPVILDIGCNDGRHTRWFLELFPKATVYCFEPDPRARERYAANVQDPRAHLFPLAISAEDGTTEFFQSDGTPPDGLGPWPKNWRQEHPKGWDYSGSIRPPKQHLEVHPWVTFPSRIEVQTKRLDTWLHEQDDIDVIDLIWADVQGAEVDLIAGGREAFRRTRCVFTEYSNLELYEGQINLRRILRMLWQFKVVTRYKGDVLLRNRTLPDAASRSDQRL